MAFPLNEVGVLIGERWDPEAGTRTWHAYLSMPTPPTAPAGTGRAVAKARPRSGIMIAGATTPPGTRPTRAAVAASRISSTRAAAASCIVLPSIEAGRG